MSERKPGWFPDPKQPGLQRWWSGKDWTAHTRPGAGPAAATKPTDTAVAYRPKKTQVSQKKRLAPRTIMAICIAVVLALLGLPLGLPGVLVMLSLGAVVAAIWALIRGRNRTFRIRSRPIAGIVGGVGLVVLVTSSAFATGYANNSAAPAVVTVHPTKPSVAAAHTSAAPRASATTTPGQHSALLALTALQVKGRAPMTGYARTEDFGAAWLDVDNNSCDTRDDVLRRDLTDTTGTGCKVLTGTLKDPYTGKVIHFVRGEGTSTAVQIDHVVSLGDAWQTGAQKLTSAQRVDLANDPINLFAVDGPTNEAKGDGDTATWLPKNKSFRCEYVAHQVAVKKAYGLWVTTAEHDAMKRVLSTCPTEVAPTSRTADLIPVIPAKVTPKPTPTKTKAAPKPKPATPSVYYANCDAVRVAGKAPLHRGSPGYRAGLDRDGDGVACESTSRSSGSGSGGSSSSSSSDSGAPTGATAKCNDGTYSYSQHHSGTCSRHGGVAAWL